MFKYLFIFLSFLFQSLAIIVGKKASISMEEYTLYEVSTNVYYLSVLFLLFLQAIFWQLALKYFKLSYSYMFMSLIYPVVLFSGYFFYGETISTNNIVGTIIILLGVLLLLSSGEEGNIKERLK
ncbi:MAG: hypothetical protein CR982_05790 [Candidatus Cloacimonadota bacterium]|nr:MAG: hypothetical protein CR982_05790 [Candidatus Cloacimonadota bacterium]PIE81367.1 MAG: hypothetical protein CSA15_00580 [Candidatus Delongbacteria bacterium]